MTWLIAALLIARTTTAAGPVKQIDHVIFTGGPELSGLISILRDTFQFPVVFDGAAQTPPAGGTCLGLGNVCLEVVAITGKPGDALRRASLGSLMLQATDFAGTVEALTALEINHFPPAAQPRWTVIGLRGLGGGMFFIEYHQSMDARRAEARRALESRNGGPLGVIRVIELARATEYAGEVRAAWIRLFGEPAARDPELFIAGDGPAIRLMTDTDGRAGRMVVLVRDRARAAAALRRLGIQFEESEAEVRIDPTALFGLKLIVRDR